MKEKAILVFYVSTNWGAPHYCIVNAEVFRNNEEGSVKHQSFYYD